MLHGINNLLSYVNCIYLLGEHPVVLTNGLGRDEPARSDLRCHNMVISGAAALIRGLPSG